MAGLALLVSFLRRDRRRRWRPGAALPDVPADAAIRRWLRFLLQSKHLPEEASTSCSPGSPRTVIGRLSP
jgi:hypothetical protein